MIATLPTTVISPSVSKPRKSTRMTFTTLRPPAGSSALAKKNGASTPCRRPRDHGERERGQADAGDDRERGVARAARACARSVRRRGVVELEPPRQPAQAEQEQHHRHDLDGDLREREIRRGEPGEREAGDEPGAADHDQRRQPVELRLPSRADRARARRRATSSANSGSSGRDRERAARASRPTDSGRRPPRSALATIRTSCGLQAPREQPRAQRARAARDRDVGDVEHPLAVEARQQRRRRPACGRADTAAGRSRRRRRARSSSSAAAGVKPCHTASSYAGTSAPRIACPAVASSGPDRLRREACRPAGRRRRAARSARACSSRLVRRARQVVGRRAEEHLVDEAQRVRDAEQAASVASERQQELQADAAADDDRLLEEHFLREEAVQQRHAGHRAGGDESRAVAVIGIACRRPFSRLQVARAGLVIDDAGRHEQRRLERRVIHHVEHGGDERELACSCRAAA